ncbi:MULTISPECIES: RNA-guided endonuclease TnpB family protein [Vibrio]|uniref:Transposase n=6 Tax=Vibrio harveyi group TaxID=717610 RepID=A0AA92LRG0_9VIBR|nr:MULTISPECIES: RNA-guided endonuclease TnpB family protein [Vibrio]MBE4035327.1 IS200/IS605 family element transposase accessory protein TnpB [Vibrio parahaemolyticus]ANP63493.1 transposase [Vibrio alginolyticus]EGQ8578701.1 IS200/IS605 family element transposase accessory protein TnpB [Vibrio cholerae]EGR1018666.1 transposase [Vibrio cholerae]ELJ8488851.1 transposase [Vibrio cholerae]
MLRATKIRIYPTQEQAEFLIAQFGAVRFAYNKALHLKSHMYRKHGVTLNPKKDIKPLLAVAKKSRKYQWLKEYDSIALQQSVINLHQAFDNFFNPKLKAKYPQFKRRHGKQSSYHCVGVKVLDGSIKLPKMKPIEANVHREIEGVVKSITVSLSKTGKFYASILADDGVEALTPLHTVRTVTGVDLGLSHFAIESNGRKTANPRFVKRAEKNLRRKQRQLSRKAKGSANRAKARILVAKCHEKVANARADFQHKLSRTLVDENQAVIVETLKSANMMKSRKLAKHIADASWHSFVAKLEYKLKEQGKHLVKLDQWYASSKTCHCCGHKMEDMPLSVRKWDCPSCGTTDIDRDLNAALNIRDKGILELKAAGRSFLLMEAA